MAEPSVAAPVAGADKAQPTTPWRKFAKDWVIPLSIVASIVAPFRSAIADWNDVPTGSMEPTILPGDRLFVNKLAYGLRVPFTKKWVSRWNGPESGEVVILFSPADGQRLVKRVIAGPGDTIEMNNNHLAINGKELTYESPRDTGEYFFLTEQLGTHAHAVQETPSNFMARRNIPYTVIPSDSYFVMGDNRDNSADSRYFGVVPRANIVGRAAAVALSVDPQRSYMPRWKRFFTALR